MLGLLGLAQNYLTSPFDSDDEHTPSEPNSPFSKEANPGDLDTRNMAAQMPTSEVPLAP
jgi:hypothetical protein